jgi:hypothetical protein
MSFWFKQDSRNTQTLFSSNNWDLDVAINSSRSSSTFLDEIDSWGYEVMGLARIWRVRDHTNINSGRNRMTQTDNGQYDRYHWAYVTMKVTYDNNESTAVFYNNCSEAGLRYTNFSPKLINKNPASDPAKFNFALGTRINWQGQHVADYNGFIYQWEFLPGDIPVVGNCSPSLSSGAPETAICDDCAGHCVPNLTENLPDEGVCLINCWDGFFKKGKETNALGEVQDDCEFCDFGCFFMWTIPCDGDSDTCICKDPAWTPFR